MCGRTVTVIGEDGIARLIRQQDMSRDQYRRLEEEGRIVFVGSSEKPGFSSYNVAPTKRAPIVINEDGQRAMKLARWSYVPPWWFERNEGYPKFATFNARDDKLQSSGMWKGALNKNRCLVPISGFYEWEKKGKQRLPYYIKREDEDLIGLGGLYSSFKHPETGKTTNSFTIITTPTNSFMEPLHDRIPLMLGGIDDELWSVWLDPQTKFDDVAQHVKSHEWSGMTMHRVSTDVNATGKAKYFNEPRLIEPIPEQE